MRKLKLFSREQVGNAPLTGRQYSRPDSLSLVSRQSVLAFLLVLLTTVFGVGNVWGATTTYQHIFSAKPSTGNNVNLSSVSWNITATQLGNYNSTNYAGVQLGTKSASGSITLTSSSAWGSVAGDYKDKTVITEVRIWMNAGTGTPSGTVTIGGVTATDDGTTVTKNSSASSYADATCVTYTPASNGNTGVVVITVSTSSKAGYICAMEIDCEEPGSTPEPAVKSVQFTPNGGEFLGSQSVTLSQEDNKAIYYTYDAEAGAGTPSTSSPWALYESALNLTATTTIYAAALDGSDWSAVTSKTFTKIEPLTTMDAIFAAATAAGNTATDIYIDFQNWVVSGANGKTAYVTDGTKGFIIYYDNHGFAEGDILSGVGSFKIKLYNGAAEITAKNSGTGTITITKGGTAHLNELDADGISALSGINTGSLIKINGTCSVGSGKYYINNSTNTVQVYTTLYSFTSNPPEATKEYNCTGVYVQYNATKEIMPRKAADIAEVVPAGAPEFNPASKKFVGSISVELSQENSLPIYYTDDASKKDAPSITTWTEYTSAIPVTATKTIYAAAKDGDDWSDVVDATYTLAEPLTTMTAVQAAATSSTDQLIDVTITNWVVTAVDNITGDNKRVWIADADNENGILLYAGSYAHGFTVGKKLNGTVLDTKIKAYQGYAELTSLKAADVEDVTDATAITARITTIAALGSGRPAEQGTIVKLENVTYNGTAFTDGENTIEIDTRLYTPTLTSGKRYNLTGVVFYSSATAIKLMPRSAADIEPLADKTLSSISISGEYPTTFEQGDEFSHEGIVVTAHYADETSATVTASATFSGYNLSATGAQTVTVSYIENEVEETTSYDITVNAVPTLEFELLEGELVAGDYVIYDGGSLMKADIESSRFAYVEQEPDANGIISTTNKSVVWTLAKSGDYWTIYNAKTGKYAAGTEAANKAQLLDDGTDDKSLWSISEELVVTNKANAAKNVNATLRHNVNGTTNYGFACYGASTGGKPVFYKKAAPSYSISATLTGCTADAENAKKVPQALDDDVVLKYNLTTGYIWPDVITVKSGETTLTADDDYIWDNTSAPAELLIEKEAFTGNIAITITATEKSLENITIVQAPTKVAYETGEFFNPAGLQIQLNYTAGAASDVVVYNDDTKAGFTFSPNLETALAKTDENVEITYAGKSVNQAITVTDPVETISVVAIIAKMGDNYYAMSTTYNNNAFTAIPVIKDGDDYTVPTDEAKADILWTKTTLSTKAKFQGTDDDYLAKGNGNTDLVYSESPVEWTWNSDGYYYYSSGRTFFTNGTAFKNYATSNISATGYSDAPEFIAEANIKVVPIVVHEFVVEPDEDVAFGTVEVGESVSSKSFDVTLTNIASATVTLSDDAAFSIDVTALTADGTITVTPNTASEGNFSATITLHDAAGEAEDKVINVTMKVVAPRDCDRTDDFETVSANSSYTERKSDEGWSAVYTAVVVKDEVTYWMINGKTSEKGVITSPEFNYGIKELSLSYYYPFNENHGISFKIEIKQNGSVVKEKTITKADAIQNTIYEATFEEINVEGKFQIVFTNLSPSNSTSSKDRFAIGNLCWKKYGEPVYETVRSGLEINRYYTVCLPKKVTAIKGASFWTLNNKSQDGATAYLEEETNNLPFDAGKPFIIQATAENLEVVYEGAATEDAGTNGALHGTLVYMNAAALAAAGSDVYMLFSNKLRPVGENNHLDANRAYVKLSELNAVAEAPQGAPGKRVRAMPMQPQVATGFEAAEANEAPRKVLINGEFFIIRGEKMYDAKGQLVK